MYGPVVGRQAAPGHLREAQQLHHRVGRCDRPILDPRHEVFFEVPVDPGGFRGEVAFVGHVRRGRQVQHLRADAERDQVHEPFEFIELLEASDLPPLEAAHHGVPRSKGCERGAEDAHVQEAKLGIDVHGAMRHRRPGEPDAVVRVQPHPLEEQRRFAARRLDPVLLVRDNEVPVLLLGPRCERVAPGRVVIDDRDEGPPKGLRELHLFRSPFLLLGDRADLLVERRQHHRLVNMPFELRHPHWHDAQRANDQHAPGGIRPIPAHVETQPGNSAPA